MTYTVDNPFTVRLIDLEKDYPIVSQWWPAHGWPSVPKEILPRLGLMVECNGTPCVAGWLYMDNSIGVSMLEWTVSNPANNPRESYKAIQILVDVMRKEAVMNDYGVMLTSTKHPALVRAYQKAGFAKSDEGITHLVMITRKDA